MFIEKLQFKTENDCLNFLSSKFNLIPQYTGDKVHYVQSKKNDVANFGSQTVADIGFHNDGYDFLSVPSHIALYCDEQDCEGGETFYSDFDKSLSTLTPNETDILFNHSFFFQTDPAKHHNTPTSGLTGKIMENNVLRFSYAYIKRLINDEQFLFSLEKLNNALLKNRQSVKLEAGDLIIINNRNLVHGRSAFTGKRKLARLWLSELN